MNERIKARWLSELRSGRYKQGKEFLNKDEKLCCLGVLCEIAVDEGVITRQVRTSGVVAYDQSVTGVLPEKVSKWAGLPDNNPWIEFPVLPDEQYITQRPNGRDSGPISNANDGGLTFMQIADEIESQL